MTEMDAVDSKQQQEIENLQKHADKNMKTDEAQERELIDLRLKDAKHDAYFGVLNWIVVFLILTSFLNWFILFMVVMKK